jgi:hypothetical protein
MSRLAICRSLQSSLDSPLAFTTCLRWIALLAACAFLCGPVKADGCFVWRNENIDIHEPEQKALIYYFDGLEDLVLSVRFEGAPEEFGWIVPLPAQPKLFAEDASIFECLSRETQDRQYRRSAAAIHMRSSLAAAEDGIQILGTDTVGIFRAQVLQAASGEALEAWLAETGYRLPEGAGEVLDHYVRGGWVFTTLRILTHAADAPTGAQLADGTIQPVRFQFAAREPVFPLRISSLGRSDADVLLYVLAPEILVPANPPGEFWDSSIFSTTGEQHWIYQYEYHAATEDFLPDYQDPFYLTKHRARLAPAQMEDITFEPYNPAPRLRHEDTGIRREAVTHLGLARPVGADVLLIDFLAGADKGAETYCTLWALGEVGGARAEKALLRRAKGSDPEMRLEALAALGRMGSRRAVPLFVSGLAVPRTDKHTERDAVYAAIQTVCFETLVRLGDPRSIASLRSLAESHDAQEMWLQSGRPGWRDMIKRWMGDNVDMRNDPGVLALAILTALREPEAFHALTEAIVQGGQATSHEELQIAAGRGGSINDIPYGFWTGQLLLRYSDGSPHWPALSWTEQLFRFAPEYRDSLYRACAADPRMPAAGAVVLLGILKQPGEADFARLRGIWTGAIRPPTQTIPFLDVRGATQRASRSNAAATRRDRHDIDPEPTTPFNYVASEVAYALSLHGRVEDLIYMWETTPQDDPVLRGEIIFAMARQRDPRFREAVFSYVREVWNPAAAGEEVPFWLQTSLERSRARDDKWILLYQPPLDLSHRIEPILNYVLDAKLHGAATFRLICDRSLSPYLRLILIDNVHFRAGYDWAALQAEADHIRDVHGARDPLLRELATHEIEVCQRGAAFHAQHRR